MATCTLKAKESSPDPGDQVTQSRTPLYPVSKATKDLIFFLEQEPPPGVQPIRTATVSTVSLTLMTKSAKSGNWLQCGISKINYAQMLQDLCGRRAGIASAPGTPLVLSV